MDVFTGKEVRLGYLQKKIGKSSGLYYKRKKREKDGKPVYFLKRVYL
ncbi:MAG: hypothetical protein ACQERB_08840 [Promethearchaeati archaeon]